MSNTIYVTYLTIYHGDLLPPYYIGSTYIKNIIENDYHGSVSSKKYKSIWKKEIKNNPNLFETIVISKHSTRKTATKQELKLQQDHNVVKNDLFINLAYAIPNGFFGHDMSGKNNPMVKIENRKKVSDSKLGKLNYKFSGYYHTPFGILESSNEISKHTNSISVCSIKRWCKHPDKIICFRSVTKSNYLERYMIGKTFRDVGFWFEPV